MSRRMDLRSDLYSWLWGSRMHKRNCHYPMRLFRCDSFQQERKWESIVNLRWFRKEFLHHSCKNRNCVFEFAFLIERVARIGFSELDFVCRRNLLRLEMGSPVKLVGSVWVREYRREICQATGIRFSAILSVSNKKVEFPKDWFRCWGEIFCNLSSACKAEVRLGLIEGISNSIDWA